MWKTYTLVLILFSVANAGIVVSIPDLKPLVEEIYGESVESILPSNVDPHMFSLSYRDLEMAKKAKMLILANSKLLGFEEELKGLCNETLDFEDYEATILSFPGIGKNYHAYWLYPENGVKIALKVKEKLSSIFPENAEKYEKNFERFVHHLSKTERDAEKIVSKVKNYDFIAMDPHVAYAISALKLNVSFVFPEEISPSILEIPKKRGNCILVMAEYQKGTKLEEVAKKLASEMECGISVIDVLSNISYESRLVLNAARLSNPQIVEREGFIVYLLGAITVFEAVVIAILWRLR
ncbi:MAG: zinc ABC transporter substrate-binding protein [Archaeoglobaceae archaeon]